VSTHKVGEVAQTLMGVAKSASSVSRLNQSLTEQFEAWRERSLQSHYRVIYLDGVHFTVRHREKSDAAIILTALGVDLEGSREVLAALACAEESKDGWNCLLQDLRIRGVASTFMLVRGNIILFSVFLCITPRLLLTILSPLPTSAFLWRPRAMTFMATYLIFHE
jgi:putative transposase